MDKLSANAEAALSQAVAAVGFAVDELQAAGITGPVVEDLELVCERLALVLNKQGNS